ncbi:MAG: alpha/beta fold hydrolase [Candidatus Sumerlaeaceae bacterium]
MTNSFVFISGIDGTADLFRSYESRLRQLGYSVLFYEHAHIRCWGECADLERFAAEVKAMIDKAGTTPAIVCGESFGGPIALTFARVYPDHAAALVLLGTFAHLPFRRRAWLARTFGRQLYLLASLLPGWTLRFSRRIYNPAVARSEPRALREAVRKKVSPTLSTYLFKACLALSFDARRWLPGIRMPSLVIAGEKDRLIPPQCSCEIAGLLQNARLVTIPNSGHLSHYAYPEKFWAALEPFLKSVHDRSHIHV